MSALLWSRDGSASQEAQLLAPQLASERDQTAARLTVDTIRDHLHDAFQPRYERALSRFDAMVSQCSFGGVRCLVVEPKQCRENDVILHFYGGGYISGAPEYEMPIAAHLSHHTNRRVVMPYYALAPENPYPAALNEGLSVYRDLMSEAHGTVVISGESAGGGLALSLVAALTEEDSAVPEGLCLFSPWVDMTEKGLAISQQVQDPSSDFSILPFCANAYCTPAERAGASPITARFLSRFPPIYLTTGSRDIMWPTLENFADKLRQAAVPLQMKVWPGMWHVFELYDELPEAAAALDEAASFISGLMNDGAYSNRELNT